MRLRGVLVASAAALAMLAAGAACDDIIGLRESRVEDAGSASDATVGIDSADEATEGAVASDDAMSDTDAYAYPDTFAPDAPDAATDANGGTPSDAGCTSTPALHPRQAGTIPCQLDADGGPLTCTSGTECCDGKQIAPGQFAPNDCEHFGAVCSNGDAGGIPIQCNQPADCTANGIAGPACCLVGAGPPSLVPACGYYKVIGGSGIVCESNTVGTCNNGSEIEVCESNVDCPSGKTCVPVDWKIFQIGVCM